VNPSAATMVWSWTALKEPPIRTHDNIWKSYKSSLSSMDSGLEAFSLNRTHGSFSALTFQSTEFTCLAAIFSKKKYRTSVSKENIYFHCAFRFKTPKWMGTIWPASRACYLARPQAVPGHATPRGFAETKLLPSRPTGAEACAAR
jgi:hypothetical protein